MKRKRDREEQLFTLRKEQETLLKEQELHVEAHLLARIKQHAPEKCGEWKNNLDRIFHECVRDSHNVLQFYQNGFHLRIECRWTVRHFVFFFSYFFLFFFLRQEGCYTITAFKSTEQRLISSGQAPFVIGTFPGTHGGKNKLPLLPYIMDDSLSSFVIWLLQKNQEHYESERCDMISAFCSAHTVESPRDGWENAEDGWPDWLAWEK